MINKRPNIFIGSSTKGLSIANALQEGLYEYFEVNVWNQGVFGLMQVNLDALTQAGNEYDYAVLVLTPDDEVSFTNIAGANLTSNSPRDNIIFEIGFFLGALGRKRTFIVYDSTANLKIPSDLAGLSFAKFTPSKSGDLTAALGPACTRIKNAIEVNERAKTDLDEHIKKHVESSLQMVSKALTIPVGLDVSQLRAFIFKKVDSALICTHYWSQYPVKEVVGLLKFDINPFTAEQVAIVKAAIKKQVVAVPVAPLGTEIGGVEGEVDEGLCFVLAAPIPGINSEDEVWGTVDFDASSAIGEKILRQQMSQNVIFELGRHLSLILNQQITKNLNE